MYFFDNSIVERGGIKGNLIPECLLWRTPIGANQLGYKVLGCMYN